MPMPTKQRVTDLIQYATQGRIIEAMTEFYTPNCTMQENSNPPTVGLEANIEREKQFVDNVAEWHSAGVHSFIVDGDRAAIHWHMDFTAKNGARIVSDQIAWQRWEGDKIAEERFFYEGSH